MHTSTTPDLERWLQVWPSEYQIAVEVRHDDWYAEPHEPALMNLLHQYDAGRVVIDVRPLSAGPLPGADVDLQAARDRKPDVPVHPLRSSDIALIRYIGHPTPELNGPLLDEWAKRVAKWLADGTEVYLFCQLRSCVCTVWYGGKSDGNAFHAHPVCR